MGSDKNKVYVIVTEGLTTLDCVVREPFSEEVTKGLRTG